MRAMSRINQPLLSAFIGGIILGIICGDLLSDAREKKKNAKAFAALQAIANKPVPFPHYYESDPSKIDLNAVEAIAGYCRHIDTKSSVSNVMILLSE